MSIQRSITDHFILRILCHRLGSTSEELYNKVFNLLTKTCQKILLPSSLPKEFKVQAKQKVPEKDWFMGWIKCQYYNDIPPVEWPECQMAYKCNAAFIILDIANYDPQKCSHELKNIKRTLYNEQIFCYYLLVWNSDKGSASCYEEEKEFIIVPDMKTDESLSDFLYKQTQLLVVKTGIHFFQVIEKLSSDVYVIALFNAKEEIPKDQIKVKKRKQGRALKLCGDLAIILGCWSDANGFYTRAHKQLEINDDYVWLGKVKEGQMACLYMQFLFGEAEQGTADQVMKRLARDSKEKLEAASACYKKVKTLQAVDFDVELYFKRLRIFKDLKSLQDFQELFKQYSEVVKSSLKGEETYKAMLLIASFFYDMKMYKKAGLYLKLLGDSIVADNYDLVLARDIYLACFPLYSMCLPESTLPESFPKREFLKTIIENEDLKSGIMRVAPALQMQLIIDVVRLSNNEKPLQAKMLSIILRYFMEDLDVKTQKQVFAQFMMLGQSLHTNLTLDLSLVPKLLKVIPLAETSKANIKFNDTELSKSNIFIYNPWKGDNDEKNRNYNWMEGSFCCVKVQLSNVFPFEIFVEMIMLVTEGIQTLNYPVSMNLHSRQPLQEIILKFKPLEAGKLHILGVMIKVSNFMHFHPINSKGICIEPAVLDKKGSEANGNHHQNNNTNKLGIREIPIQESISTLNLSFEDKEETLQLCKKSPFHARVIVKNKNDCFMRVHKITIVLVFSDSSIFEQEYDPQESKLKEYGVSSIVIYRSILKEEGNVLELFKNEIRVMFKLNLNDIPNIDMLSKISIKLTYFQQHRPTLYIEEYIAKSVNMKQGLSVTRLGVYGSFINNTVSFEGQLYKHINVDNSFYLSLEVVRADPANDENEYVITFQREDTKEIIGKESLSSHQTSIKVVIKLELSSLQGIDTEPDDFRRLIIGKWTEKNLIGSGYLFMEDIDMSPLTSKLRDRQLEVSLDVGMPTKDDMMEAVIGQFYTIKAKVKWLGNEAKSLYCFTVICRDRELDSGKVMKKEKNVVYKGKKYSVMEFGRGKVEDCMSVDVMLMKRECYKVFFFAVDNIDSTIYSLKHPYYISVT